MKKMKELMGCMLERHGKMIEWVEKEKEEEERYGGDEKGDRL